MSTTSHDSEFVGFFDAPISAAGRIVLPDEWQGSFVPGQPVALMPDPRAHCIQLMTEDAFNNRLLPIQAKAKEGDPVSVEALQVLGTVAELARVDEGCGVEIPGCLCRYAGLSSHAVLVGASKVVEIWSPENHSDEEKKAK